MVTFLRYSLNPVSPIFIVVLPRQYCTRNTLSKMFGHIGCSATVLEFLGVPGVRAAIPGAHPNFSIWTSSNPTSKHPNLPPLDSVQFEHMVVWRWSRYHSAWHTFWHSESWCTLYNVSQPWKEKNIIEQLQTSDLYLFYSFILIISTKWMSNIQIQIKWDSGT